MALYEYYAYSDQIIIIFISSLLFLAPIDRGGWSLRRPSSITLKPLMIMATS